MALAAILLWYLGIGVLAAVGAVTISRARFSPRIEHIFFALLLIPIAAMYLAFLAYFGDHSALRLEAYAVALFAVLGLLGLQLPALLMLGYALHGAWDLFHEVLLYHGPTSAGPPPSQPSLSRTVSSARYRLVHGGILLHQTGRLATLSLAADQSKSSTPASLDQRPMEPNPGVR